MRYAKVAPSKDSLNEFFSDNFKEFQETFTEQITERMEELHDKMAAGVSAVPLTS